MKITNIDIARTIDFINECAINFYTRESEKAPNVYDVHTELYSIYGIDLNTYEHAFRIMEKKGLVSYITLADNDETIKEFKHTDKGLLLFLNGGMAKKLERKTELQELRKSQIQSVIKTNRIQKIALILSVSLTLFSLIFLIINSKKINEIRIQHPIEVISVEN